MICTSVHWRFQRLDMVRRGRGYCSRAGARLHELRLSWWRTAAKGVHLEKAIDTKMLPGSAQHAGWQWSAGMKCRMSRRDPCIPAKGVHLEKAIDTKMLPGSAQHAGWQWSAGMKCRMSRRAPCIPQKEDARRDAHRLIRELTVRLTVRPRLGGLFSSAYSRFSIRK